MTVMHPTSGQDLRRRSPETKGRDETHMDKLCLGLYYATPVHSRRMPYRSNTLSRIAVRLLRCFGSLEV